MKRNTAPGSATTWPRRSPLRAPRGSGLGLDPAIAPRPLVSYVSAFTRALNRPLDPAIAPRPLVSGRRVATLQESHAGAGHPTALFASIMAAMPEVQCVWRN